MSFLIINPKLIQYVHSDEADIFAKIAGNVFSIHILMIVHPTCEVCHTSYVPSYDLVMV